jgi:hypothetical protein
MSKYSLDFILNTQSVSTESLKNSIIEFGEALEISLLPQESLVKGKDFRVRISTDDPTIIFDTCAQLGKLKSIKIDEERKK